jgi:choline dehydrogenase-like flavoprotein
VYVVDGAAFPGLPAKSLTFTIMANALRIARRVAGDVDSGAVDEIHESDGQA